MLQRLRCATVAIIFLTAGCGAPITISTGPGSGGARPGPVPTAAVVRPAAQSGSSAAQRFVAVVRNVEPVAERVCRQRADRGTNCNFAIAIDDSPGVGPNAFQTLDRSGRPVVGFTLALIRDARNADELAFILGHETAHHIAGHISRARESAVSGAVLAGILATVAGADAANVRSAQNLGAQVGARRYSKSFELEADALGTVIAELSGYDPVRGAEYFTRIPDPGNRFLGTHPPNADRIATVRRAAGR